MYLIEKRAVLDPYFMIVRLGHEFNRFAEEVYGKKNCFQKFFQMLAGVQVESLQTVAKIINLQV